MNIAPKPELMREAGDQDRWCIVGGGMLGLALAHKLAKPGRSITVLEASDRLGGLADAWKVGPVTWDRHYHVSLLSDSNLRSLLKDIGIEDELRWTTTKTDFYTGGQFHPLNNAIDYLRFPVLGLIDKFRLAATILYASRLRNGVRLESTKVADWLIKISGKRTYDAIWKPLLRAKLGDNHTKVSASFIWSVINRFYAARRSGLKTEMFGYVRGGYRRIIEALANDLEMRGVRFQTGQPVSQIVKTKNGHAVHSSTGEQLFDHVVVTAPGPLAARMCQDLEPSETDRLSSLSYQGVVCASLVLKKPLRGRYLTYVADESLPFTGVIEMTAVVDRAEFDGQTLVYLPRYVPSDDPLFEISDAEIEADTIHHLKRMYPHITSDDIVAFRVSRARHVLAIQSLNYSANVPNAITSVPGLFVVNSAQIINGNLNVDETIALANDAAEKLAASVAQSRKATPVLLSEVM